MRLAESTNDLAKGVLSEGDIRLCAMQFLRTRPLYPSIDT